MKISKLPEWVADTVSDNISVIVGIIVAIIIVIVFYCIIACSIEFPEGTDVIVKGTEIHGTVTKLIGENDVEISVVSKDGTVKTMTYNTHLIIRTPR